MTRFAECLPLILRYEGGWVNDPDDRGGATNHGVTQRVYDAWRAGQQLAPASVSHITPEEVAAIYERDYWTAARCHELPAPLDLVVFDAAVNSGVKRSVVWLQRALGVTVDGVLGPITLARAQRADRRGVCMATIDEREASLRKFAAAPGQAKFLKGWLRRTADLRRRCA